MHDERNLKCINFLNFGTIKLNSYSVHVFFKKKMSQDSVEVNIYKKDKNFKSIEFFKPTINILSSHKLFFVRYVQDNVHLDLGYAFPFSLSECTPFFISGMTKPKGKKYSKKMQKATALDLVC